MARLILVHGGVHGSWCWEKVLEPLRALGHDVETVDLPGREASTDALATVTLDDWVACLSAQIDTGPTPVTLVAHSMGGISASIVASRRPDDVAHVVYVAAVVPRDGEGALPTLQSVAGDSLLFSLGAMNLNEDQTVVWFDPERVGSVFYNTSDPADVAWARERICPDAVVPMVTPVPLDGGFAGVPKTYFATLQDRAVPIALQRSMAQTAGAEIVEFDTDHSPFVSATADFVRALDEVVRSG
jgi:pimeloyl-ACP methyl ester carboxylesterase